ENFPIAWPPVSVRRHATFMSMFDMLQMPARIRVEVENQQFRYASKRSGEETMKTTPIELEPSKSSASRRLHPLALRIMHWINALAIFIMIGSGWKIPFCLAFCVIGKWRSTPFGVLVAKLGRSTQPQRIAERIADDLAGIFGGEDSLRMQRGRHVDAFGVVPGL